MAKSVACSAVFPAVLLGTNDERRDLAVLRTQLPPWLSLKPELMVHPPDRLGRSARVWYVGRAGEWYVPSQPGTVNSLDLHDRITIDGLNVQVGTSGGPLLTEGGLAGMIIEDTIGGVARATDVGFIERAFAAWNHPWGIVAGAKAPPQGVAPDVVAAPAETSRTEDANPLAIRPTLPGIRTTLPAIRTIRPAIRTRPLVEPTDATPLVSRERPPAPSDLDAQAVRIGLTAFAPRAATAGAATSVAGALTLRDADVTPDGAGDLEVAARVELEGVELGRVTARVTLGETPGSLDVGLAPEGDVFGLEIEGCDVHLQSRGVHLVWNEALATFVSAQIELGPSTISCAELDVAVSAARLDLAFEPAERETWEGWLEIGVEELVLRICGDLGQSCATARADGFVSPWRNASMVGEGTLHLRFEGADLASRMAAFEAEAEDFWPRYSAFAAPILDPLVAAAGVVEPARVADYLGTTSASLSTQNVTIDAEGIEVAIDAGKAELAFGRPADFAYELSGVTMTAPGVPPRAPSRARVQVESAGRLDPATLLSGGMDSALADAAPFMIEAQAGSEFGRIEGTASLDVDRVSGPKLLAAEATLATRDPVGYVIEMLLGPMAAQVSNVAAFERAVAEVVALTPTGLPPAPGHERAYAFHYDR